MTKSKNKKYNEQNTKKYQKKSSNYKNITNKQRTKYDDMRQIDWEYFGPFYWD